MRTPCVVSRVDEAQKTVNVCFPNVLSQHFNNSDAKYPLLFAIETHPAASIRPYEGNDLPALQELLSKALLYFVERRGRGLLNAKDGLQVSLTKPSNMVFDSRGEQVGGPEKEVQQLQANIRTYFSRRDQACRGDDDSEKSPLPGVDAAAPRSAASELETPPPRALRSTAGGAGSLVEFMRELSALFGEESMISRQSVERKLGDAFPTWSDFLQELDNLNKVLVQEDVVFRV